MTVGIGAPFSSSCVAALNALQNSMMLSPRWPSAGPIGGDGLALPAGTCSLTYPGTFFTGPLPTRPRPAAGRVRAVAGRGHGLVEVRLATGRASRGLGRIVGGE